MLSEMIERNRDGPDEQRHSRRQKLKQPFKNTCSPSWLIFLFSRLFVLVLYAHFLPFFFFSRSNTAFTRQQVVNKPTQMNYD